MNSKELRDKRRYLHEQNKKYGEVLANIPQSQWPDNRRQENLIEVWRSRDFVVQVFQEDRCTRFSVNRTELNSNGGWRDGITWDDIQKIKRMIGRDSMWGTELYPPQDQVVNVANIRHVWLFDKAPGFAWIESVTTQIDEKAMRDASPAGASQPDPK